MITTHDALPAEAQSLVTAAQPIRLHDWTNCAPGTTGGHVLHLERIGLWKRLRRYEAVDPMASWTEYGPK